MENKYRYYFDYLAIYLAIRFNRFLGTSHSITSPENYFHLLL